MGLILTQFTCEPKILTPKGGKVRFRFSAKQTSTGPSHMQARFWIDTSEDFAFATTGGGTTKRVFLPSATTRVAAPTTIASIGPKKAMIVPRGGVDRSRTAPLQVNLHLQGFDAAGNKVGEIRDAATLITMDPVSLALGLSHEAEAQPVLANMAPVTAALRLVANSLGLTQQEISRVLKVHPDTVSRVMRGERSEKLEKALVSIFKGEQGQ